ncbi:MAG: hypothetical protein M1812_006859 [Candelaria pacifica]|nr:MAG: hypothetical protein M1812_006859 [Candelaria pacifica]
MSLSLQATPQKVKVQSTTKVSDMSSWLQSAGICQGSCSDHFNTACNMIPRRPGDEPPNPEVVASLHRTDSYPTQGLMGPCLTSRIEWNHRTDTLRRLTGVPDPTVNGAILSPLPRALSPVPLHKRLEQWIETTINETLDASKPATEDFSTESMAIRRNLYGHIEEPEYGGLREIKEVAEEEPDDGRRLSKDFTLNTCQNSDWPAPLTIRKPSIRSSDPKPNSIRPHHKECQANVDRKFIQACAQHAAVFSLKENKGKERVPTISELRQRSRFKSSSTSELSRTYEGGYQVKSFAATQIQKPDIEKPLPLLPWERLVSASLGDVRLRPQPEVYQPTHTGRALSMGTFNPIPPSSYKATTALNRSQSMTTFAPSPSLSTRIYKPTTLDGGQRMTAFTLPLSSYRPPSPIFLIDYALATEEIHNLERINSASQLTESSTSSARLFAQRHTVAGLGVGGGSTFPMKRKTSLLRKMSVMSLPGEKRGEWGLGLERVPSSVYSREVDGTPIVQGSRIESEELEKDGEAFRKGGTRLRKLKCISAKGYRRISGVKKHIRWPRQVHC